MFADVNGIRIFYEKMGDGVPLLLIHGNGENHKIFQQAITILCRYFTVYAVDLRGHGRSSTVQVYHYEDMAYDMQCFIQELYIEKPVLYGFSDGGIIGLLLAFERPDLLSGLIISGANLSPKGIKLRSRYLFWTSYCFTRDAKIKMMLKQPDISKEKLEKIKVPVLVTAGSRDVISKRHTMFIAEHITNSELQILSGETHGSYIADSDKIADIIIRFCQSKALLPSKNESGQ